MSNQIDGEIQHLANSVKLLAQSADPKKCWLASNLLIVLGTHEEDRSKELSDYLEPWAKEALSRGTTNRN